MQCERCCIHSALNGWRTMAKVDATTSQRALDQVLEAVGLREADYPGTVTITGQDPVLA